MTPDEQIALVQQALVALALGDLDSATKLVANDVVWFVPGRSTIAGEAVGLEQVRSRLQRLIEAGVAVELLNVMSAADQVVTVQRNHGQNEGRTLDITVLNLATIRDGRLARLDTFPSDLEALDRFWGT